MKNDKKLEEMEEYYLNEIKKSQIIMKDQTNLITSFENRIETTLAKQKKMEERHQKQILELQEVIFLKNEKHFFIGKKKFGR